jgi:hypothetical protein
MLSTSALIGGIDHGFVEVFGQIPARKIIEHTNWLLLGLLTFFAFLTIAQQFLAPPWRRSAFIAAWVQLVTYASLVLFVDKFLLVIVNYAPVMLLLLLFSLRGLKQGTGSWPMIFGVLTAFFASGIQAAGVDIFSPFDRNSLYHFAMMVAVVFFYRGGLRLRSQLRVEE